MRLTKAQLRILKLADRPEGCSPYMKFVGPSADKLKGYGFITVAKDSKNYPLYRTTESGKAQLAVEAARKPRQHQQQPITEAIDFPPDGRDFGGGADF